MVQWTGVTRDVADKAYVIVRNREGATITQNLACCYDMTTSFDGLYAMQCNATDITALAGIADENIADNDYGRVQAWGYRASIYISNEGSSVTITKGDVLCPLSGAWGLNTGAVPRNCIVLGETITISAAVYVKGLIRCV